MYIKYINTEKTEVVLNNRPPFYITSLEGFDAVENIISSVANYGQDGETVTGQRYAVRDLTIEGTITADSDKELQQLKREITKAFVRDLAGTLYYSRHDKEYMIDVLIERAPKFIDTETNFAENYMIQLTAMNPYWMDASFYDSLIPLSRVVNLFEFPLNITENFEFATISSGEIIEIENNGDTAVGAVFYMEFIGAVKNPRIYNVLTQEYFGFNGDFTPADKFELSTEQGNKYAKKISSGVETNAMPDRMTDSTFLMLKKGMNYLQVQAESGVKMALVNVKFKPLVIGV
ncbi:MAG: phage tail family protein [Bacillota bacterium]|nr:phage tail family protein [Bacillota bacterium]